MGDPAAEHQEQANADAAARSVGCVVITVSDTRTPETDRSGAAIAELLDRAGHRVLARRIVPDEPAAIEAVLAEAAADPAVRLAITTGGTGLARRDTTVDVVRRMIAVEIEGFGELFRVLSHREIGAAAMLSRATAGLLEERGAGGDTFVFALPGSTKAVRLALRELIVPQIPHLAWLRREA